MSMWERFDCVVHVPVSENCGGVVEPLSKKIPTIASQVGGLPEVVLDGVTGWLVPPRDPRALGMCIVRVLESSAEAERRASLGQQLVRRMFDVSRTATEVAGIYEHVLGHSRSAPPEFDSSSYLREVMGADDPGHRIRGHSAS